MQIVPTHINAFYRDLADAKQAVAVAQGKVDVLEEQITGMGYPLPNKDGSIPNSEGEDTATSEDVSAAESKPLDKMNRDELNAIASEKGIEAPEELGTKKDVLNAIVSLDATSEDEATE